MGKAKKKTPPRINWKLPLVVVVLLLCGLGAAYWWHSAEAAKAVRALEIHDQDLSQIHDGVYYGGYTYGGFTYEAEVTIENYTIKDIKIISNRSSKYAKMAEGVVPKVLAKGNVNVDVVAGATTTSKALLKAIEQAIECNL